MIDLMFMVTMLGSSRLIGSGNLSDRVRLSRQNGAAPTVMKL